MGHRRLQQKASEYRYMFMLVFSTYMYTNIARYWKKWPHIWKKESIQERCKVKMLRI